MAALAALERLGQRECRRTRVAEAVAEDQIRLRPRALLPLGKCALDRERVAGVGAVVQRQCLEWAAGTEYHWCAGRAHIVAISTKVAAHRVDIGLRRVRREAAIGVRSVPARLLPVAAAAAVAVGVIEEHVAVAVDRLAWVLVFGAVAEVAGHAGAVIRVGVLVVVVALQQAAGRAESDVVRGGEEAVLTTRPAVQPLVAWQRRQKSPTPGTS
jgi:hypothetical protein